MPGEIEEIVGERIDILASELKEVRASQMPRWELWVSLFSSLLAVLSAVVALLATFASNESSKMSELTLKDDVYIEGLLTTKAIITTKIELLKAVGKNSHSDLQNDMQKIESDLDGAEINRVNTTLEGLKKDSKKAEEDSDRYLKAHDMMVIAITLFQLHILLGGLSVMVHRISVWKVGFLFTGVASIFLINGVIDFLG
jgi:hypothetical protein